MLKWLISWQTEIKQIEWKELGTVDILLATYFLQFISKGISMGICYCLLHAHFQKSLHLSLTSRSHPKVEGKN